MQSIRRQHLTIPSRGCSTGCAGRPPLMSNVSPTPVSCAQPPVPALRPVPKAYLPFGPPALGQQAPPAILLAALRRFRGSALFRGLRLSSSPGAPFGPSGLTRRSSRPAYGGRLTLAVSLLTSPSSHPMPFQTAATRSSASSLGRGRCGGLRLFRALGVQGFWGASASASCAGSYCFCSPWPLRSCPFLRCGSNTALKRTRILRAAYLVR